MIKTPNETHYAVISERKRYVHHEGDERSRTNPGHGYPAHTETIESINYEVCENIEKVENLIKYYNLKNIPYIVIEARPMTVETKVVISIT